MSKINSDELVDIFKEEVTRKEKKDLKKKKQLEKKLEKKENIEFEKMTKEEEKRKQEIVENNKLEENTILKEKIINNEKKLENNDNLKKNDYDNKISVHSFLYDTMFGFFLVLLFLCTLGYCCFLLYNSIDKNNIIKCTLLSIFMIFYIISLTNKKQGLKMFTAIISSAAICLLMVYLIYSL